MEHTSALQNIAPNLWTISYPLKALGADLRRVVTILRLKTGKLIIHSTAPFEMADAAAIRELGEPGWLVDALLRHDTFAQEGRDAFPGIPYFAPEGFSEEVHFPVSSLAEPPEEWAGEVEVLPVEGAPSLMEYVFIHAASRTLIVCDLLFNFGDDEPIWTEVLLKLGSVGGEHAPGMTRIFKMAVKDEPAFLESLRKILARDFDRIIVAHGDIIESGGKALLSKTLHEAGYKDL